MQFNTRSLVKSRLSTSIPVSLSLTIVLLALVISLTYAADVDSITQEDHNHPLRLDLGIGGDGIEALSWEETERRSFYEPEFQGTDRGIIGRAEEETVVLGNNAPKTSNIRAGEKQYFAFPNQTLWGPRSSAQSGLLLPEGWKRGMPDQDEERIHLDREVWYSDNIHGLEPDLEKRQDRDGRVRLLYISFNTCLQPSTNSTQTIGPPPQLQLYVSQSDSNQRPGGPDVNDRNQQLIPIQGGFGNATLNATGSVYIGVAAPNHTEYVGIWNYELAASIDAPYHSYSEKQNLFFIDSDTNSALFVTSNMTEAASNESMYQKWMAASPPFSMFAHNENDTAIRGIENSYCGLKLNAQIVAGRLDRDSATITNRGPGSKPKEQFHIKNLNGSSSYYGFLAMDGNSRDEGGGVVGGGGKVWKATNFFTKSGMGCPNIFSDIIADSKHCRWQL